ncbi:MAG: hypothetical protein F6K31_00635 [Symploca sp. SIO2G7]|nr:hypothetical protein [Symploca sp. SIO2G7]
MRIIKISTVTIISTIAILGSGNLGLLVNRKCSQIYTKQSIFISSAVAAPSSQTKPIPTSESQLLTIYEPIQNFEWEGMFVSPQGIAYFAEKDDTDILSR